MTTLGVLKEDDVVWLFSDTQSTFRTQIYDSYCKWVVHGDQAMGLSGDAGIMACINRHKDSIFDSPGPWKVWPALIAALKADGFKFLDTDHGFPDTQAEVLYVHQGKMWDFDCQGGTTEISCFIAKGSGARLANGAMAMHDRCGPNMSPERLLTEILEIAAEQDTLTSGKWIHRFWPRPKV